MTKSKTYPDFDVKELQRYAAAKGVTLIMHHETSGSATNYERRMEAAYRFMKEHGYDAVKTGYVADMGGIQARGADGRIRFEWHEGQVMARHHLKVVTEAAKRKAMERLRGLAPTIHFSLIGFSLSFHFLATALRASWASGEVNPARPCHIAWSCS